MLQMYEQACHSCGCSAIFAAMLKHKQETQTPLQSNPKEHIQLLRKATEVKHWGSPWLSEQAHSCTSLQESYSSLTCNDQVIASS
jgi:hypothetical protein